MSEINNIIKKGNELQPHTHPADPPSWFPLLQKLFDLAEDISHNDNNIKNDSDSTESANGLMQDKKYRSKS